MPNIRPYETQTDIPPNAPSGRAAAAGAGDFGGYAAQAFSNLGGTIGQISDEMERRRKEEEEKLKRAEEQAEVSELNVKISKAQEEWSTNLDERLNSAAPGDKTIVPKFTDELDNYFSQLGQDIKTEKGRQYFNEQTANLHTHLLTAAYQGQARLAGVKAKEDFNTALNSSSSALVNDPSSFSITLQRNNAYINQLVDSGLSSADAAQLRINSTNELATSAIRGWISLSHQEAKQQLDSGQWNDFIDGQTKVQMYGEIEQAERAERIETERQISRNQTKNYFDLYKQTRDAESETELELVDEEINRLYNDSNELGTGGLTDGHVFKLSGIVDSRREKIGKITSAREDIDSRLKIGMGLDSSIKEHRDYVDQVYESLEVPDENIGEFVSEYQIIPAFVKSRVTTGLSNPDNNTVLETSRMVKSIHDNAPVAYRQFNDFEAARFMEIAALEESSFPDPVKFVKNSLTRSSEEKTAINEHYKQVKGKDKDRNTNAFALGDYIQRDFEQENERHRQEIFGIDFPVPFTTAADPDPQVTARYDNLVRAHFENMAIPDMDTARERAWENLKDTIELDLTKPQAPAIRNIRPAEEVRRGYANKLANLNTDEIVKEAELLAGKTNQAATEFENIQKRIKSGETVSEKEVEKVITQLNEGTAKAEILQEYQSGFMNNLDFGSWSKGGLAGMVRWYFKRKGEEAADLEFAGRIKSLDAEIKQMESRDLNDDETRQLHNLKNQKQSLIDTFDDIITERYEDFNQAVEKAEQQEDIDFGMIFEAAKNDPGGLSAHLVNAMIADPEYFAVPLGALRTAGLAAKTTAQMTKAAQMTAKIVVGAGSAGVMGAVAEIPISMARQLGDSDVISSKRTLNEVQIAAGASALFGAFLGPFAKAKIPNKEALKKALEKSISEGGDVHTSIKSVLDSFGIEKTDVEIQKSMDTAGEKAGINWGEVTTDLGAAPPKEPLAGNVIEFQASVGKTINIIRDRKGGVIVEYSGVNKLNLAPDEVLEAQVPASQIANLWENLKAGEWELINVDALPFNKNKVEIIVPGHAKLLTKAELAKTKDVPIIGRPELRLDAGRINPKLAASMIIIGGSAFGLSTTAISADGENTGGIGDALLGSAIVGIAALAGYKGIGLAARAIKKATVSLEQAITRDDLFRMRRGNIATGQRQVWIASQAVLEELPDKASRAKVTRWIDGDDSIKLTAEEHATAQEIQGYFRSLGNLAEREGIINGMLENYVTHLWKRDKGLIDRLLQAAGAGKFKFGKERTIPTIKEGEAMGLKLETDDIAEIMKTYGNALHVAVQNKRIMNLLKDEIAPDSGKPFIMAIDDAPKGYQTINDVKQLQGMAVHPDLAPPLKMAFGTFDPPMWYRGMLALNFAMKRSLVALSAFHANALLESSLFSGLNPKNIPRYADQLRTGQAGDIVDEGLKAGLKIGTIEDVGTDIFYSSLKSAQESIDKLDGVFGAIVKSTVGTGLRLFEGANRKMDYFMWDRVMTGGKIAVFAKEMEKALLNPANKDVPRDVLAREIAGSVNDMFGGQNWAAMAERFTSRLGRAVAFDALSPKSRTFMQLLMFAPDWTISNLKVIAKAIPGFAENPRAQALHFNYFLRGAAFFGIVGNTINIMMSGHPLWENKEPLMLELGDGRKMQFSKQFIEPFKWVQKPWQTAGSKLGIIPKEMTTQITEKEWISPYWAPRMFDEDAGTAERTFHRARHAAQNFEPIFMQQLHEQGLAEGISGFLGHPIYGYKK